MTRTPPNIPIDDVESAISLLPDTTLGQKAKHELRAAWGNYLSYDVRHRDEVHFTPVWHLWTRHSNISMPPVEFGLTMYRDTKTQPYKTDNIDVLALEYRTDEERQLCKEKEWSWELRDLQRMIPVLKKAFDRLGPQNDRDVSCIREWIESFYDAKSSALAVAASVTTLTQDDAVDASGVANDTIRSSQHAIQSLLNAYDKREFSVTSHEVEMPYGSIRFPTGAVYPRILWTGLDYSEKHAASVYTGFMDSIDSLRTFCDMIAPTLAQSVTACDRLKSLDFHGAKRSAGKAISISIIEQAYGTK